MITRKIEITLKMPDGTKKTIECTYVAERLPFVVVPPGYHKYSIRHSDEDWCIPTTVEHRVMVNHFGDILVEDPLDLGEEGYLEIESTTL